MALLTISGVARQVGLQPSTIRYYERIGLMPHPLRVSGQRRYDTSVLYRLALIQRARELGFSLEEVRELFLGFRNLPRASDRWRKLCHRKLNELDTLAEGVKTVRRLLKRMMRRCTCATLDQCGRGIFRTGALRSALIPVPRKLQVRPMNSSAFAACRSAILR